MRRFWAHITLVVTTLLLVGSTFFSLFTRVSSNIQYREGSEITYRLTNKDDTTMDEENVTAVKDIADVMQKRLDSIGITEYNIKTYGNDIIKVQFAEPNNLNKNNIIAYLGFNGSLGLSNMDDDEHYVQLTGAEFLSEDSKVYLDSINEAPTVVIPVNTGDKFQNLVSQTQAQKDANIGEKTTTKDDTTGEDKEITTTYLYLWYDFDEENDRYSKTVEGAEDYDINVARKIIMKFKIDELYYPDGDDNKIYAALNVDSDGSQTVTLTEVRNAYNTARFYANLLNSEALDYKVTRINEEQTKFAPATIETLVNNADTHQYVAWSNTLIVSLCSLVLISVGLAFLFKLSTTSIVTTTLLSLFASIGFIVLLSAEFNIAAVIGLVAVTLSSLASGIYYANKLKEEIYRGRTLKKANTEAHKKTLLATLDIHLGLIFIGVLCYLLGGSLMRTFALVTVIGGLISLILSLSYFRMLMWLLTNNTSFVKKFSLFGVKEDKIIEVREDEVRGEPYKGKFAKANCFKHSKIFSIIAGVLCAASLSGLITFGVINHNEPLNTTKVANTSELFVYSKNELLTLESLENDLLTKVAINGQTLNDYVTKSYAYSSTKIVAGVQETTYYFEYELSTTLDENTSAIAGYVPGSSEEPLRDVLSAYHGIDDKTDVYVKLSDTYLSSKADFGGIVLATSIALVVMGLYFVIRYKLSRGIAALLATVGFTTVGFGLFSLTRIAFPTFNAIALPLIALVAIIATTFIMNREKQIILEDKAREIDFARRGEIVLEATATSINDLGVLLGAAGLISLLFIIFGPASVRLLHLILLIAYALVGCFALTVYGPLAQFLYKFFSPVENARRKKARKKNKNIVSATHRSKEPEEATFIGIND